MLKLKKISWIALILLVSCQLPQVEDAQRCLIDPSNNVCYCQGYEYTEEHIGKTSDAIEYDLGYCQDHISMPIEDFQRIRNAIRELYELKKIVKKLKK